MLDEEIKVFEDNLNTWLSQHKDRVVLIKDKQVIGFFDTETDALAEGARRFGLQSFLVRRVTDQQIEVSIPALTLGLINAVSPR